MALAAIAHEGLARFDQRLARRGRPHDGLGFATHGGKKLVQHFCVEHVEPDMARPHHLVGDRGAQEAEGGTDAGAHRHDHLLHPELAGEPRGMQRRGATEGDQRAVGRVLAVLDGVHARGTRHGLVDDLGHAGRRALGIGAERAGQRLQRGLGLVAVKRNGAAGEARRVEPPQRGIGVGHGGLGAAAPVTRRTGHAARGIGTDLDAAQRVEAGDRAAAGADLDQFDDGDAHRQAGALHEAIGARDFELARALQLEIVEQGELGRGAAHVEGDGAAGVVLGRDRARQDGAAGRSGFDQPHGIAPRRVDRRDATRRHHQQQGGRDSVLLQVGFELAEIACHARQHIGVGDGGRGALVFADLGTDLARQRDGDARQFLGQDRADTALMGLVGEAVQEADRDRLDLLRLQFGGDAAHGCLVERQQHGAVGCHALRHAEAQVARYQRLRPLHVDVVLLEAVLPRHLDGIAEALRRDQRRARTLALDQRIGGQRRAVDDESHVLRPALRLGQDGAHALQDGALGRVGRGQDLDGMGFCSDFENDVGERAADIDGQTGGHAYSSILMLPVRTTSPQVTESRFRKAT